MNLLEKGLQQAGIDDILVASNGVRSLDISKISCDYYEFLNGNPEYIPMFQGMYMTNYTWAEERAAFLNNLERERNK